MKLLINQQGKVENIQVLSGDPLLAQPAVESVRKWVYEPVVLDGIPVIVETTTQVHFRLSASGKGAAARATEGTLRRARDANLRLSAWHAASTPVRIVLVLIVVAALAGLVPAWRASRVDPMIALRME